MVHADHVNLWWGVELLIPLLKHTKYYYFLCKIHVSTDANTGESGEGRRYGDDGGQKGGRGDGKAATR